MWTSSLRFVQMVFWFEVSRIRYLKFYVRLHDIIKKNQILMVFILTYLHNDRTIILFYTDNSMVRSEMIWFIKTYKFKIKDEWTLINYLHLANPMNSFENINSNYGLSLDCFIFEFVFIWCIVLSLISFWIPNYKV